ncbi:hypothetical protein F2P56_001928 [Juglans regia]|uniref:Uncharacterized protein n=1 Tax=Juglans regia TaxID=51240 RepID=A0A833YFN5_JUGRE|nr:hypothetical protein F2P56_001928 [Juglans regia]
MEIAVIQTAAAKKNRGEGGAPSSWAGGARSYSEVLKKVPHRAALDVMSVVTNSEDVQRHGGEESRLVGLNEESILRMLAGLEEKIGIVLDEINYLKRCVKGEEVVGRNGGLGMGLGSAMGFGKGQVSGPVKAWRAVDPVGSGKVLGSEISDQGQRVAPVAPISSSPATLPAQKLPTTSADPSGETVKELQLGSEISDQGQCVAPVAPISPLSATLPAQKLPTTSIDHSGETVKVLRREEVEEGEFLVEVIALTSASASASSSPEILMENGLSELCMVDEVPEVVHEQSGLQEREMSLCGEEFSRDSEVVQSGLPLLVMSSPDELFSGDDIPLNNMVLNGETNKLDVSVIPNNSVGEEGALTPLCTLPPSDYGGCSMNWIFKKVEEL